MKKEAAGLKPGKPKAPISMPSTASMPPTACAYGARSCSVEVRLCVALIQKLYESPRLTRRRCQTPARRSSPALAAQIAAVALRPRAPQVSDHGQVHRQGRLLYPRICVTVEPLP